MTAAVAMTHEEWLDARRTGLGGSDMAAALGYNPYRSPLQVYLEKRGEIEEEDISDKEAVIWGNALEDSVAQEYARRNGVRVARVNTIQRHREHPWMLGNYDRRIIGVRKGLEVKTAGSWAARSELWGPSDSDEVPAWHLMQCHHYMTISGYDEWDLAVLIGGNEYRQYTIKRDPVLEESLIELGGQFWHRIQTGDRPPITRVEDGVLGFPTATTKAEKQASQEIAELVGTMQNAQSDQKTAEALIKTAKTQVMEFMGNAEILKLGDQMLATWGNSKTTSLDTASLKTDLPEVYDKYARRGTTRKFIVKGDE